MSNTIQDENKIDQCTSTGVKEMRLMKIIALRRYAKTLGTIQGFKDKQMKEYNYNINKMDLIEKIKENQLEPEEIKVLMAEYDNGYIPQD